MIVHGVILAAGASSRMGTPKALLTYNGRTFLDRLLDAFNAACDSVAVVTSSPDIPGTVTNPQPERGMLSSLQCALAAHDADAYIFTPVDYPAVRAETIASIVAAFRANPAAVIIPLFENRHGHPVCVSREVARDILALPPTSTAREAINAHPVLDLPVDDPAILRDIDTPEQYAALVSSGAGNNP